MTEWRVQKVYSLKSNYKKYRLGLHIVTRHKYHIFLVSLLHENRRRADVLQEERTEKCLEVLLQRKGSPYVDL